MLKEIDLDKIYDIREYPDKNSGRCDNCDTAQFKSTISKGEFIRKCAKCGMKRGFNPSSTLILLDEYQPLIHPPISLLL